ncbi:MAG: sulfatase [Phycisphaerae bacterium]
MSNADHKTDRPNLVFVFADQWRAQALGYAGDPNVHTPNLDRFACENLQFTRATSGCPVCSPWRATLMTGVYPHRHGMTVNDQCLAEMYDGPFLGECLREGGYRTAWIGKWHIDGHGRKEPIPPSRRLGFEFWRAYECSHSYQRSYYYDEDDDLHQWEGYDAFAQTDQAGEYLRRRSADGEPFALFLSWGPPHFPIDNAPEKYKQMYDPAAIELRPNVPEDLAENARQWAAGYYAHCTALDDAFANLLESIESAGLAEDTIVVFTSDHGDMLGSHRCGLIKQVPQDESVLVPMLMRMPGAANGARTIEQVVEYTDLMPTLLGLCGLAVPSAVQGRDLSAPLRDGGDLPDAEALLACYLPFHQWKDGYDYRGLRTERYTYVRGHQQPTLLWDNQEDPCQLRNLVKERPELVAELDQRLQQKLAAADDGFPPGEEYVRRFGYALNDAGDIAYS